ncbi:hypothetical protein DKP78_24440, partial [Enterococcus faecium]
AHGRVHRRALHEHDRAGHAQVHAHGDGGAGILAFLDRGIGPGAERETIRLRLARCQRERDAVEGRLVVVAVLDLRRVARA